MEINQQKSTSNLVGLSFGSDLQLWQEYEGIVDNEQNALAEILSRNWWKEIFVALGTRWEVESLHVLLKKILIWSIIKFRTFIKKMNLQVTQSQFTYQPLAPIRDDIPNADDILIAVKWMQCGKSPGVTGICVSDILYWLGSSLFFWYMTVSMASHYHRNFPTRSYAIFQNWNVANSVVL